MLKDLLTRSAMQQLLDQVAGVARTAGEMVIRQEKPRVFTKAGHANYVTSADIASQKIIIEALSPFVEGAHFIAEEYEHNNFLPGDSWVIDPIDGTTNFMRGLNRSAISIGLISGGVGLLGVVYNPYTNEMFSAATGLGAHLNGKTIRVSECEMADALLYVGTSPYDRTLCEGTMNALKTLFAQCADIRRSGSAALDLCDIAAGRADGFYELSLSPWDYAASSVILREAGGRIGTVAPRLFGYTEKIPIIAANQHTYASLVEAVRAAI